MKNKISIAAMTEEEREEYMLNCAAYKELARKMTTAAIDLQDKENNWVFGCSFFPDSVFTTVNGYGGGLKFEKETTILTVSADDVVEKGHLIFDDTNVDMTRPFAAQTAYINYNQKKDFFLTLVQYLD